MILVITAREYNDRTGRYEIVASHGIDMETDRNVVLPQITPRELGARLDRDLGEFVIDASPPPNR